MMKKELNLIIIEDDESICQRFTEYADTKTDISVIATTGNSYHALDFIQEYLPDALILDLELNQGKGNGLLFLQKLNNLSLPFMPYILITTNNSSSITLDYARQLGADFIMSKHQEDYSEKYAIDFLRMLKNIILDTIKKNSLCAPERRVPNYRDKRLSRLISLELDSIGISPKALGYRYLNDAILLVINGQNHHLCTIIGEKYSKTNASVERAMQNAINTAWRSNDIDELLKCYTARIHSERGVPTLTEFIYYYANKIQQNLLQ